MQRPTDKKTLEYWVYMVRATTKDFTEEEIAAAAQLCLQGELTGVPCSTWHAAAQVGGFKCNCARCTVGLRRFY